MLNQIKKSFHALFSLLIISWVGNLSAAGDVLPESEGLWEYTGLITSKGESLPLTGVFLIKDGAFLQQAVFNGEPFAEQGSMAHSGAAWAGGAGLRLTANQTLSLSPVDEERLSSMGKTEHDLKVTRDGDQLTLVFGAGTSTVQTFQKISDAGNTRVFTFKDGAMALVDDYFILVSGNKQAAVTGYGTFKQSGNDLTLNVIRWAQSDGKNTRNLQDVTLDTSFDGKVLNLPGGRQLTVTPWRLSSRTGGH